MAVAQTVSGRRVYLRIGDGESVETFAHPCSLNDERSISFETTLGETVVVDCDDPEAPGWPVRVKQALSCTIEGGGALHHPDLEPVFWEWLAAEASRNCQLAIVDADDTTIVLWTGKFHLTSFVVTGPGDNVTNVQITAQSDGPITLVPQAT